MDPRLRGDDGRESARGALPLASERQLKIVFTKYLSPPNSPILHFLHRPYETPDHVPDGRLGDGACREGCGGLLGDDPLRQVATDGLTYTQKV